ncbi:MAG: hypothetical protein ACRC2B_08920 [Rubrivivax sp.]
MSNNQWESGAIKIPAAAWAGLKKTIRDGLKQAYTADLATLKQVIVHIKAQHKAQYKGQYKGQRQLDWEQTLYDALFCASLDRHVRGRSRLKVVDAWEMAEKLTANNRLRMPKKQDLPVINNQLTAFQQGELEITLNDATRTLHWYVNENNHAVDQAHVSFLGRLVLDALGKVCWKAGSGGVLVGNDEINCDSEGVGGGANYITGSFGPLGQHEQRAA